MSDTDPTPSTPVTVGDRLAWFRGAIAAQLAAISGTPAQGGPTGSLAAIAAQLAAIAGTPAKDIAAIVAAVTNVRGNNEHTLSSLYTKIDALDSNITGLRGQITLLQEGLGANPYHCGRWHHWRPRPGRWPV